MADLDLVQEGHYNVRQRVLDFARVLRDWRSRSDAYFQSANVRSNIRYGEGDKATLDLFMPKADGPVPLHIFIHGGYWQAMDKADHGFIAKPFVEQGVAVAIINYDLCPDVTLEHIIDQMRQAIRWAWQHGADYGIDSNQIHISGHSAGGHLVAALLATDWKPLPESIVKSCVTISGLYDLSPLVHTTINDKVGLSEMEALHLSPLGKTCHVKCPILCIVGGSEGDGFLRQSENAVADWSHQELETELVILPSADHFGVVEALADPNSVVFQKAIELIKGRGL